MTNWVDELVPEYKQGRAGLREMKRSLPDELKPLDGSKINGMISSMGYSIEWMETGRQPGTYRGMDKRDAYRTKQYDEMEIIPDITDQLETEREPLRLTAKQRRDLLRLFKNLSERERQCFVMHEAEQLSMQKIADRLGIKKRTVQQYIERARKKVELIAS